MMRDLPRCCRYCGNWTARSVDRFGNNEYPVCPVCKFFLWGVDGDCLVDRGGMMLARMIDHMQGVRRGRPLRFGVDLLEYKSRRVRYRLEGCDLAVRCKCAACAASRLPVRPGPLSG